MKPTLAPLEQITALRLMARETVPADYRDLNNHMNVRYYMAIFDEAGYPLYEMLGLTPDILGPLNGGGFDLEHHLSYLNEVLIGDEVAVYLRMLKRTAKRMHYLMFMVNITRGQVAAIFECVNSYADLSVRKTAPWPAATAARLDTLVAESDALEWPAPVCGVIAP
ncbi:MAG: thioesterase family protein [Chloroflexi bacterium]|nr:thioesterase family protein [Chloroflexota bacterium]